MTADLSRFHAVDAANHATALREIRAGEKRSHWMWYVFPQLRGLGVSQTAQHFGLTPAEAAPYLADPVLGLRLVEISTALLDHARLRRLDEIFGPVDAMKLRSSMTLFATVPGAAPSFREVLAAFAKTPCPRTLEMLGLETLPEPRAARTGLLADPIRFLRRLLSRNGQG